MLKVTGFSNRAITFNSRQAATVSAGGEAVQSPAVKPQAVPAMFEKLRTDGILSADNRTDTTKGIYESDTKQIIYDAQNGIIQVNTPMSQGATVIPANPGFQLTDLSVKLNGIDAAVYAGSLTQQPLAGSTHILFLVVPDSLNTMMRFTSDKRQRLVDNGRGPVLMRTLQADFSLHNSATGTAHLWALANTGDRVEEITRDEKDGALSAHIDTAALKNGPTPYFEIVRGN